MVAAQRLAALGLRDSLSDFGYIISLVGNRTMQVGSVYFSSASQLPISNFQLPSDRAAGALGGLGDWARSLWRIGDLRVYRLGCALLHVADVAPSPSDRYTL